MTTLLAQAHDRVAAGGCDSKCIDGYVRAPLGDIHDGLYGIRFLCIDHVRRPNTLGQFQFGGIQIDADYVSAAGGSDIDRGQTDPTTPEHCHPFTRFHLRAVDDPVEQGYEATAHGGGLNEVDTVRKIHQVEVRERHAHQTAEAARIGKAWEQRSEAHVGGPIAAEFAGPIALAERHHDAVAFLEVTNLPADFLDDPAELMAEDRAGLGGQSHPGPVARPGMPVGAAHAIGFDLNDRAVGRTLRVGNVFHDKRFLGCFEYRCSHGVILLDTSSASRGAAALGKTLHPVTVFDIAPDWRWRQTHRSPKGICRREFPPPGGPYSLAPGKCSSGPTSHSSLATIFSNSAG